MTQQDVRLSRRRYVAAIASASSIGVVGCIGGNPESDGNESATEDPETEDAPNGSDSDQPENGDADADENADDRSDDAETAGHPTIGSAYYDGANTGSNPVADGPPSQPTVRWDHEFEKAAYEPVVADGRAVFTLRGWRRGEPNAFALDLETGERLWSDELPRSNRGPPALVDDTLYFHTSNGRMVAHDAESGEELWSTETDEAFSPLAVDEDRIYAPGDDRLDVLDREGGEQLWTFTEGRGPATTPAVDGDTVYVVTYPGENVEEKLTALDAASGSLRWQIDLPFDTAGSPPVVGDEAIFLAHDDQGPVAIDPASGEVLWDSTENSGDLRRPPAVADGRLYHAGDRTIWALDASTGELLWQQRCGCDITTAPAVVDGTVYVGTDDGVGAYDAAEGDHRWTKVLPKPASGQPVVVDGTVLVPTDEPPGGSDESVYALE